MIKLKYFELNENENSTYQNVWAAAEGSAQGEIYTMNAYIRKE